MTEQNLKPMAVCRFCGQALATDLVFDDAAEAEEWASRNCDCPDAKLYSDIEASKDRARRWMSELEEKAMDIVCNMIAAIGFEVIDAVTIKLDSNLSVGLKKNGNGKITVKLNRKKTESFDL